MYNGQLLTEPLKKEIHHVLYHEQLEYHLCMKYGWSDRVFSTIDWEAHASLLQSTTVVRRVPLVKFLHGWLAIKQRRF